MNALLSLDDIKSRFESEWVLVDDPETDESLEVVRGRVVFHSKDRDEVYRKAIQLKPKRFAMLFTGTLPQDIEVVL